jgi:hypothetical protein
MRRAIGDKKTQPTHLIIDAIGEDTMTPLLPPHTYYSGLKTFHVHEGNKFSLTLHVSLKKIVFCMHKNTPLCNKDCFAVL